MTTAEVKTKAGELTSQSKDVAGLLLIYNIFIKLVGAVSWSWWIVTWPLWLPIILTVAITLIIVVIGIAVLVGLGIFVIAMELWSSYKERKTKREQINVVNRSSS